MESRWFLRVVFIFQCLGLSKTQYYTPQQGVSCLRSSPAGGHTLVAFLRHDAHGALFLYLSKWSDNLRITACEINTDPHVIEGYQAFCNKKETRDPENVQKFDTSLLLSPDAPCALVPPRIPEFSGHTKNHETEMKTRRKRSWIFPGTLWCGTGSKASGYEQLGMFERADKCCREHDHCSDVIPAFTVNYGVFNPNFFTVSHCECDQRFRQCLLGMNDSISSMVGYSFFNILKVPCFELKQQKRCTQMYWWGMCKKAREAPYAVFRNPLPFNNSDVTDKNIPTDTKNLTNMKEQLLSETPPMSNPQKKTSQTKRRCGLRDPPRGDTFHRRRTKEIRCKGHQKLTGEGHSEKSTTSKNIDISKSKALTRDGRQKKRRKDFSGIAQKIKIPLIPTTTSTQKPSITIPSNILATTRTRNLWEDATKAKGAAKKVQRKQKAPKRSKCCGSNMAISTDNARLHCKTCLKQTAAPTTTVTLRKTSTDGSPVNHKRIRLKSKTATHNQETKGTIRRASIGATPTTREQKMMSSLHKKGKPEKQQDSHLLWKQASQQPLGHATIQTIHAENILAKNDKKQNIKDNEFQCQSVKQLDDCKFKIPPLEKKYNLTNMESKTVYHCDCTNRLAAQIKSLKEPGPPRSLLVEFVSKDCFTLTKENKCNRTKRCSGGFTKPSALHQALKKTENKDFGTMRVSASGRKKRIPVHLYKYCLRLQMRADIMAQLK